MFWDLLKSRSFPWPFPISRHVCLGKEARGIMPSASTFCLQGGLSSCCYTVEGPTKPCWKPCFLRLKTWQSIWWVSATTCCLFPLWEWRSGVPGASNSADGLWCPTLSFWNPVTSWAGRRGPGFVPWGVTRFGRESQIDRHWWRNTHQEITLNTQSCVMLWCCCLWTWDSLFLQVVWLKKKTETKPNNRKKNLRFTVYMQSVV